MLTTRYLPTLIGGGLLCFNLMPIAVAAQTADRDTESLGEPLVVTATRTEREADQVPARISVISRDDIERSQAPDLLELLRLEAGIDVTRNGGPGGQTSVFLRGTNSNHVLVLIDGVRAPASGTGAFTWEILDPALIERIEIVRGPRAARWGSDAIGGVIQIFTRRADGASARLAYGSNNDRGAAAALGRAGGNAPLGIAVAGRRVDGFSTQNPSGFGYNPDDDGFENYGAAGGGEVGFGDGTFSWRGRVATGEVEFDQGVSDFDNGSLRLNYRRDVKGPWAWQAAVSTLRDRLETENAFGGSKTSTRRLRFDSLAERDLGDEHALLLGVDAYRESGRSAGQWNQTRTNVGLFSGLEGQAGATGYALSLRVDDDENFGTEVTGSIGVNVNFGSAWRAFASAGRAFRAPNFNQLYSPGFGGLFAGNPDLDPERSWSTELGLDYSPRPGQHFTGSVYSTWVKDLIDFSGVDSRAINIKKARIQGIELGHEFRGDRWISEFNATWQDPEDRDTNTDLLRRAGAKYNWTLGYTLDGGHRLDAEITHTGNRDDVGGVRLPSFTLINLRAAFRLSADWQTEVRIDNLADREYQPLAGFNAADRRFFVALKWQSR